MTVSSREIYITNSISKLLTKPYDYPPSYPHKKGGIENLDPIKESMTFWREGKKEN